MLLDINRVSIGNLSVPGPIARRITTAIHEALAGDVRDGDLEQIVRILLGEQSIRPLIRLGDDRLVRLVNVEFEDGVMTLTCLTQEDEPRMELEKKERR